MKNRATAFAAPWLAAAVCAGLGWIDLAGIGRARIGQAGEVELNGHRFQLVDGLTIEQVAGPPLVDRPICADFDEQGRLYVADSSGSNAPVAQQLEERPHRIVRLVDVDGDGRFDQATTFADRMMFPEGTLWYQGSLYVAAPPVIWKLTDTNDDGVADLREEWFNGQTLTGCANDLHGPYLGPEGMLYWCKGAFATQTYERPGQPPLVTRAAHIFRRHPQGGPIEPVMTGGMDNPVELVFTPGGERIFTTTFLTHPAGGQRDGLIHAVYGGVYGKVHDVLEGHPQTGGLLPPLVHLGAAAPCGLVRLESDGLGSGFRDNLLACLFNMRKVTRHVLVAQGATFATVDSDLVLSDSIDFHPTDVLEDADGSVLMIDTGGWYKLCCPTSQLYKPDVLGAIYRLRREGAARVEDPRGLALDWNMPAARLVSLLDDSRPAVARRASERLRSLGSQAVAMLAKRFGTLSPAARRRAVWTLAGMPDESARHIVRGALSDPDETVCHAAIHAVSVWRDRAAVPALLVLLKSPLLHHRRAAAEALGRCGDPAAVEPLIEAAASAEDRVLEHSLIYALYEIADVPALREALRRPEARSQRAALLALDMLADGGLQAEHVATLLAGTDPLLRETAAWLVLRHPEWGGVLAPRLAARLRAAAAAPQPEQADLVEQLAHLARHEAVQSLLGEAAATQDLDVSCRRLALSAMRASGLARLPDVWLEALEHLGSDPALLSSAVEVARALPAAEPQHPRLRALLLHIAEQSELEPAVRLNALAAVPGGKLALNERLFELCCQGLSPETAPAARAAAATVLASAELTPAQLVRLTELVPEIGPMELARVLAAFSLSADEAVGLALVAALKASPVLSSLPPDALRQAMAKFGPSVQSAAAEVYSLAEVDIAAQRAQLERVLASLGEGDVRRGQALFQSKRLACSACHAMGYLGGRIGPDLTHIGRIRTERDLLESILFPSASFVRSYEPVTVLTVSGQTANGLVLRDNAEEMVLATGVDTQVRIAREEIEEILPGKISIMPAGLDKLLSPQELADLVAFLKAAQ